MSVKHHCHTDLWTIREHLCLSSAVSRNGDQNWGAVSRTIRLLTTETNRPIDWYSNKNCAHQYQKLLEQVDTHKKNKEKGDASFNDTQGDMLLKQMNQKHVEELKVVLEEEKATHEQLLKDVFLIESNQCDEEKLHLFWDEIVKEQEKQDEEDRKSHELRKSHDERNQFLIKEQKFQVSSIKSTSSTNVSSQEMQKERISSENSSDMELGDDLDADTQPIFFTSSSSPPSASPKSSPKENKILPKVTSCTATKMPHAAAESKEGLPLTVACEDTEEKGVGDLNAENVFSNDDTASVDGYVKEEKGKETKIKLEISDIEMLNDDTAQTTEDGSETTTENEESLAAEEQIKQERESEYSSRPVSPSDQESNEPCHDLGKATDSAFSEDSLLPDRRTKADDDVNDSIIEAEEEELKFDNLLQKRELKVEIEDTPKRNLRYSASSYSGAVSMSSSSDNKNEDRMKIEFLNEDREEEVVDSGSSSSRRNRKRKVLHHQVKDDEKPKKSIISDLKLRKEGFEESSDKDNDDDKKPNLINPQLLVEKLEKIDYKKKSIEIQITKKKEVKDEYEFDDDASRESTDVKDFLLRSERRKQSMSDTISSPVVSESTPSSPASTNYGDDPESEKLHRQWKKSIMLLWNEIASHKNASIFLKPITEEKVPGYQSVVYRPMDLQTIKRNMENGLTRTTSDFHRDILLMFLNAKMYNTDEHICRMAEEMLKDSLDIMEEFQNAQAPPLVVETPQKNFRRETRESSAKRIEERKREEKPMKRRKI